MHRGYLDQAIAFKREQSRETRTRGRRHTSQQDEWLERQRREQREQAFSTYFNGANESRAAAAAAAAGDGTAQRRWDRRRDSTGGIDEQEEGVEQSKRRGWRKPEREITGKITDQSSSPSQPLSPPSLSITPTAAYSNNPQPFASPSSSPPLVFSITPSSSATAASSAATSPPARRRTWCRGSAVELRGEDGEVVRLEPRVLQWDVEANRGPATCRRRVEAELRGEVVEQEPTEQKRPSILEGSRQSEERAQVEEEEVQTGEDTSAEVSYSGHAPMSDDNPSLSSRSSHSPRHLSAVPAVSKAASSQSTYRATAAAGDVRSSHVSSPSASRNRTPPLSPAPSAPRIPPHVTRLDFSTLFSSPSTSGSPSPSTSAVVPAPSSHQPHHSTAQPVTGTVQLISRQPATFGRRASPSGQSAQTVEQKDETGDERKEAEEARTSKRGTAWQISMELTAEEEQQLKQREDKADKERQKAQQRREARAGRRAKRSTAPLPATTSTSTATTEPTAPAAATVGRRSRPRRHTTNDAKPSRAQTAAPVALTAAAAATTAAAAEVVTHSLDDLQRSWDDLDQFLATELASLSSTAATRKHTRLSVTLDAPVSAATATTAKFTNGDVDDDEDVDAIIDDFLASTSTTVSTSATARSARPTAAVLPAVPLPILPVGSELTLRVLSVWGRAASVLNAAAVRRVECYNDAGSLIHSVPLPASSSSPAAVDHLSFSFPSRARVSLVRLWNGAAADCSLRDVELLLDDRLIFRGEIASDQCESLLFTRDEALIGHILRTIHFTSSDVAPRRERQQRPDAQRYASTEADKRVVRVWCDGRERQYAPFDRSTAK